MASPDQLPSMKSLSPPRFGSLRFSRQSGSPNTRQPGSPIDEQSGSLRGGGLQKGRSFVGLFPRLNKITSFRRESSGPSTPTTAELPVQPDDEGITSPGSFLSDTGDFQQSASFRSTSDQENPESSLSPGTSMPSLNPVTYRAVPLSFRSAKQLLGDQSVEGEYCFVIQLQSLERVPLNEGEQVQLHWNYYDKDGSSPFRPVKADKSVDFSYTITVQPQTSFIPKDGFASAVNMCLRYKRNRTLDTIDHVSVKMEIDEPPNGGIALITSRRMVIKLQLCVFKDGQALMPVDISKSTVQSMERYDDAVKVLEAKVKKSQAQFQSERKRFAKLQSQLEEAMKRLDRKKQVPQDVTKLEYTRNLSSDNPKSARANTGLPDVPYEQDYCDPCNIM